MPLADAVAPLTAALAITFIGAALLCVAQTIYFSLRIKRSSAHAHLAHFNGPWATRIALSLVAIWCAAGEISRLSSLPEGRRTRAEEESLLSPCKLYVLSNMGFAEPAMFLIMAFLLRASLSENPLCSSARRNSRTLISAVLLCLPLFLLHLRLLYPDEGFPPVCSWWIQASLSGAARGRVFCTYPLLSVALVGLYGVVLAVKVFYLGVDLLGVAVNEGVRRRALILLFAVVGCLPLRALLLGTSILLSPESPAFEAVVFSAFLALLCCASVGLWALVYRPVADSMALSGLPVSSGHLVDGEGRAGEERRNLFLS